MAEITDFRLGRIADLRFPAGANFALDFTFSGISLTGKSAKLTARAPGQSVTWSKSGLTVGATTISFNVAPADVDDSSAAFSAFCESGVTDYALTIYDAGGAMSMRLQGTVEWAAPLGDFDAGTANDASISVTVSSGSPVAVSVVSGGMGGSAALDTDTATSGLSGILKSASDKLANAIAGTDYVAVNDSRLSDSRTPTAHKTSHATGGADALTAADIGAATAAQGLLAASAVQPNTSPTLTQLNINGGGLALNVTGNVGCSSIGVYPHFAVGFPNVTTCSLSNTFLLRWDSTGDYLSGAPDLGVTRNAAGRAEINSGSAGTYRDLILRHLLATGGIKLAESTVATLPTASAATGHRYEVTDASGPTVGAIVAAGGSAKATVRSDGTNWIVIELL